MFGLREKCKERKTKREGREKELFVWLERNGGKERKMEGMNFNGPILFLSNWRKLESRDFFFFFFIYYVAYLCPFFSSLEYSHWVIEDVYSKKSDYA